MLEEELGVCQLRTQCFDGEIDVTVWEQADPLGETGAGLSLFPNGRRRLERMNLGDALAKVDAKIGEGLRYYHLDGTFVSRVVTTDSSGWNGIY